MHDNLRDHSEAGQDQNVYFGVPKESKQVLVKNRVSAPRWIEEGSVKISIRQ